MPIRYNTNQLQSGLDEEIIDVQAENINDPVDFIPLVLLVALIGLVVLVVSYIKDFLLIVVSAIYCIFGGC